MMFRQVWLWAAAALPAVALAGADTFFMGDGTGNDVGQAAAGKCNSAIGANYAAINSDQWNSTLNCGRCIQVSCDDSRCANTESTVTVYVVGECTECEDEGLDLSPTVFKKLTGSDTSRYTIEWKFTDCPTISGNSFNTLKSTGTGSGNTNYQAGKVSAADETPSSVNILQANAEGVEKTSTQQQQGESDGSSSPTTSPFFIALGALVAVCAVALAAVAYSAKKKKWSEKGECVTRSFDTFSSPTQSKAAIAKI
ncbi:hypothetical protein PRIC2_014012 [Phytophthora ramorum]